MGEYKLEECQCGGGKLLKIWSDTILDEDIVSRCIHGGGHLIGHRCKNKVRHRRDATADSNVSNVFVYFK